MSIYPFSRATASSLHTAHTKDSMAIITEIPPIKYKFQCPSSTLLHTCRVQNCTLFFLTSKLVNKCALSGFRSTDMRLTIFPVARQFTFQHIILFCLFRVVTCKCYHKHHCHTSNIYPQYYYTFFESSHVFPLF